MKDKIIFVGNKHTNFSSRKGVIPDIIVNHISQGSKDSCISWFTSEDNTKSSAHFLVGKDGSIYQFVNVEKMAWGNGLYLEDIKYAVSEKIKRRKVNPNRYTISIEHEGIYQKTKGALTKEQLDSSIYLHRYIMDFVYKNYDKKIPNDREHIIGHSEIDPIRKPFCPGEKFPFEKIISEIREGYFLADIENHWAKEEIMFLVKRKIMEGYPDNSFRPDQYITRGELASILRNIIKDDA